MSGGGGVHIRVSADEQRMIDAWRRMAEAAAKGEKAVQGNVRATGDLESKSKRLENQARRLWLSAATPMERYHDKLAQVNKLKEAGVLTGERLRTVERKLAEERDKAANTQERAYGGEAVSNMAAMVRNALGLAAAYQAIVSVLREKNALEQEAAGLTQAAGGGLARLIGQMATTPQEAADFEAQTMRLFAAGVGESPDAAADVIFKLISNQQREFLDAYVRVAESGIEPNIGPLSDAVRNLQVEFGAERVGAVPDVIEKLALGGAPAQADWAQLAAGVARVAGTAKLQGATFNEATAAVAFASAGRGVDEGATRIMNLYKSLATNEEFTGRPLAEVVREIKGRNLTPVELQEIFPEVRALLGFNTLAENVAQFESLQKEMQRADRDDILAEREALMQQSARVRAYQAEQSAEGARRGVVEGDLGLSRSLADTARKEIFTSELRSGEFGAQFRDWFDRRFDFIESTENRLQRYVSQPATAGALSDQTFTLILEQLIELNRITKQQAEDLAADRQNARRQAGGLPAQVPPAE